jgi:3-dehydroquinate synthase
VTDSEPTDLRVELGTRSYDVRVVSSALEHFGPFARMALEQTWAGRNCRQSLLVSDQHLADLGMTEPYATALRSVGIEPITAIVPPGESSKSLAQASALYEALVRGKFDRHSAVVALGGGVIGDLAGFVAATYNRGLPLVMVPTTLLAQVDSSVGGKVGINFPGAKNIIGSFHQPSAVWIDTETLSTLPDRELSCGLAEVVKYGVILDADFFAYLEQNVAPILAREPGTVRRIVAQSCRLKAEVVSKDEREETGLRAVLNFGHTIGHAIEAVAGYAGPYQHGEAVAIGMLAESRLAERLGWIDESFVDRLARLLEAFRLPIRASGLDHDRLYEAMGRDKKNQGAKIRFVLPRALGRVELTDAASEAEIWAVLETL